MALFCIKSENFRPRRDRAIDESQRKYGGYCMAIAGRILARQQDAEESVNDTWLGAMTVPPPWSWYPATSGDDEKKGGAQPLSLCVEGDTVR